MISAVSCAPPAISQSFASVKFFPRNSLIPVFPADPSAHKMKIGNIPGKKDMRASLGGLIPVAETMNGKAQLSSAASVQFGIHPAGQAEIISMEYYVEYFIIDAEVKGNWNIRTLMGHTSHHLSDTEYEKSRLSGPFNYSRDYAAAYAVYLKDDKLFYAGANFGYVFHLEGKEKKRWQFQLGGEKILYRWYKLHAYTALDSRWFQEAGFQFANHYQIGLLFSEITPRKLRVAYQFRHGLDERGQFFPEHYREHLILFMIDL
jgi:hypothetical protein